MANYTIKDLERLSGIKAHTIRIWEKRFGLIEPERTQTNIRFYCDEELKKLLNISILNRNGYKISKIASLTKEEICDNIQKLNENTTDIESQIENLAIAMIDLDEAKFEKLLSHTIIQLGFEDSIINVINPFLIRVGVMWQTGTINPAQEHFISNLIRQKLLVAIDSQVPNETAVSKTFLLFLPEGEKHEFGLLFANYIIRKRGHKVIYLGQNIPLNDLNEILRIRHVDYLMTSIITNARNLNILELISHLEIIGGAIPLYFSGKQMLAYKDMLKRNQKIIDSPQSLIAELNRISSN
jgi:MerR family transcriptional regulator, light-induced transcriptional regulator